MKSGSNLWLGISFCCALLISAAGFATGANAQLGNAPSVAQLGNAPSVGAEPAFGVGNVGAREITITAQTATAVTPVKAGPMPSGEHKLSAAEKARVEYWTDRLPLPGPRLAKSGVVPGPGANTETNLEKPKPQAPSTFNLWRNTNLAPIIPSGNSSSTNEPSTAMAGRNRFQTGNWYAAYSSNAGTSWTYLSPFSAFPSIDGGFCCDQDVLYEPSRGMFIWLLQYIKSGSTAGSKGSFRIALFRNHAANISGSGWIYYTFDPTMFGGGGGEWFDYPHLAISNSYLYIAINVFTTTSDSWTRTLMIRLPLDSLRIGATVTPQYYSTSNYFNFTPVQGAKDVMYWASQWNYHQMVIFKWRESSPGVLGHLASIVPYTTGVLHQCPATGGNDWCQRSDNRILAGAVSRNSETRQQELWWFWNVAQGGNFPYPFIDAARFRESDLAYVGRPLLWSSSAPFHYLGAAPNARGDIALSIAYGNPPNRYPGSLVCIDDDFNGIPAPWECYVTRVGAYSPSSNRWGDYLRVRPADPADYNWTATAYTLQSSSASGNAEPRNLLFGRNRDTWQYYRWFNR